MSYYKILTDEKELRSFFDFMIPDDNYLSSTESLFLSLAARNKYIKNKEESEVNLNKTFMFDRTIVHAENRHRLWNNLVMELRKLERNIGAYKAKSKSDNNVLLDIPNECFICYYNVNPIDSVAALIGLKNRIALMEQELWNTIVRGKSYENCILDVNRLHRIAEIEYSKAKSKTRWFDIDIDFEKEDQINNPYFTDNNNWIKEVRNKFCEKLDIQSNNLYIVRTYGGYHFGLNVKLCEQLKKPAPYLLEQLSIIVKESGCQLKELKLNSNGIVPLPGTLQGGKLVSFISF